jgi:hypothetical protein
MTSSCVDINALPAGDAEPVDSKIRGLARHQQFPSKTDLELLMTG